MRKITIFTSFLLSLYTSESIKFVNASSIDTEKDDNKTMYVISLSNDIKSDITEMTTSSTLWEDAIFVPSSVISLCTEGLLNIAGAPAAFWGVANAYSMIDDENIQAFRLASMVIGGVALTRYFVVNVMNQNKDKNYNKGYDETNTWGRFVKNMDNPISYYKSIYNSVSDKISQRFTKSKELKKVISV